MNKKDIATIRRQFKKGNDKLKISDIFNVYVMKESSDIYHHESMPFGMLDEDQQELFLGNFKKVLAGQPDEKLFELKFKRDVEDSSQFILHRGLLTNDVEEWTNDMLALVAKMLEDRQYEHDVVISFIKAEYLKAQKRQGDDSEESANDTMYSHSFLLCSINKTQEPKKELEFDYVEREFKYNVTVNPVINLQAPLSGFLFPCFNDSAADVNHVLYSTAKAFEPDTAFIEDVLNAEEIMTARDDKSVFEEIVKDITGDQLNTSALASVYEEINRVVEENEEDEAPKLDRQDIQRVLTMSGVEDVTPEKVETAYQKVIDDEKYEMKATSVLPKYNSKSIKIKTKVANIAISPEDLRYVRQVVFNNKRCIMIEVEEDTVIEGFKMAEEALVNKVNREEEAEQL
ncbi:hypothetical protein CHI12_15370 [Terribacillus saccharophilus]|jgi:Domain of unknown function (DUF4317)|uniref:DUF4317 domain-containing protein n=1 Tax=Terribacillus saccharophilus TaxID=361277 RepID=A0A268H9X2_9BACI|nr:MULTISPECIES: DUF4317 domain-containing protein [Terribacillus]PAE06685.1 hypothetical protein CHI12_15370 [Terribacillus saccharophilus]